jgi:hypothetical protein
MRAFWSDPYLWIHLAGVAAVPFALLLCLIGFAAGDPSLPPWLELGIVAIAGIAPIAWMQTQKPFYIFSLLAVALKPENLSEDQRKILALFQMRRSSIVTGVGAVFLFLVLQKIYTIAPIAPEFSAVRVLGLLIATIGFLAANLFLQVPLSVAMVMLSDDATVDSTAAIAANQVSQRFSSFGMQVNRILPLMSQSSAKN